MKRKHLASLLLCTVMAISSSGCAQTATSTTKAENTTQLQETTEGTASGQYKAGTYTSTVKGHNGDIAVTVTFDNDKILSVEIGNHQETDSIAGPAIKKIPAQIVEYQSLGVDMVSGATVTGNAIVDGVVLAVTEAGGDAEALKGVTIEKKIGENITKSADIVVIGAGGAGLTAAIEAKDQGAESVILMEKMAAIGGTTFTSQGVIAGYNTKVAEKLGITLTYEEMYHNLMNNAAYRLDPELTKITVEKSGETIDWLQDRVEIPFMDEIRVGYGPLQMMHVMDGAGPAMNTAFQKAIDGAGVELMLETKATELIVGADGSITGVRGEKDGAEVIINAKAVIIATGGYANNPDLTALLDPEKAGTFGIGFGGATGDGIIMANHAGAALTHTSHLMAVLKDYEIMAEHNGNSATANISKFIAAENLVLVGADGKRFVDEKSGGYMTQELNSPIFNQMHKDQKGYVWAISDKASIGALGVKRGLDMEFIQSDTAAGLAEQMGVDGAALEETLTTYNGYVNAGFDKDLGRRVLAKIEAPYYAVSVVPCEIITYGGIARNEKAEVIRADETVIPGLYVAGEAGANSAYMGFTLSNCFTWGRIAAENAAEFIKK